MNRMDLIKWMRVVLLVGLLGLVAIAVPLSADLEVTPTTATEIQLSGDDDHIRAMPEVGVEYVNWYPGSGDLYGTDNDALSLYNVLGWGGWTRRFAYGNSWAWEEDWKVSWRGGKEHNYVDQVDLAYFSGHGGRAWDSYYRRSLYGPVFGNGGRNHDDPYLVPGDARKAYGENDLEWVVFSACQTLNNTSRPYWGAAMDGLHLILGFKTNMYDVNQGWHFGWRIRWNWRLLNAWFTATDITHPHRSVVARVLADDYCHFRDRGTSHGCGDSSDWYYWWWDHTAGSEHALLIEPTALDYEMPVFSVLASAPTQDDFGQLTSAFGFDPQAPAMLDEESQLYHITDNSLDLTVDQQGMYYFSDLDKLWVADDTILRSRSFLSIQEAKDIADTFLETNNLMLADAEFYEVVTDSVTAAVLTDVPTTTVTRLGVTESYTDVQETISNTYATNQQVIYSRHLVYTPTARAPITFSVQGPGARLKVYLSNDGQVIGAMGGWRIVDQMKTRSTVQIITTTQMISLYHQLGNVLGLAATPFKADVLTVTRSTIGYYEQPMGINQSTLTPVYILDVAMSDTESGGTLSTTAFIPAAASLMNPLALITSYADGDFVSLGDTLTLTAADASQPLSALGYGDNLDFALGQAPYTYTWKLATTSEVIGSGRSATYILDFGDYANLGRDYNVPLPIVLEVTDGAGNTTTDTLFLYFLETLNVSKVYLQTITR